MPSTPVSYFEIIADSATELAVFYRDALGWEITADGPGYVPVRTGQGGIDGAFVDTTSAVFPPGLTLTLAVNDIARTLDTVQAGGGLVVTPRTEVPGYGTFAMFADPAGNRIGLTERPQ
jgi:hypothetical protein